MQVNTLTYDNITSPMYILEEEKLIKNLELIQKVQQEADVEIILAYKAYALWKTFPLFRKYINATTASSLWEARLAAEEFGAPAHTYSPAYTPANIGEIARLSSHLTFNSLSQYAAYHEAALKANPYIDLGLRVNPGYSEVGTDIYNPCCPGTRFGIRASKLPGQLPADITGLHCHCHCESGADVFQRTLVHIEEQFSSWFDQIKWINFGGGHLMTRRDYDVPLLIRILNDFHKRYPHLHVILEPGSAFGWQTGVLVAHVVDVVEDEGISTAIMDVSFTCHMPDCLEMPYMPAVRGARVVEHADKAALADRSNHLYRLGGCSCLSGDYMGYWQFKEELKAGDTLIFEDMLHYTTVKTNMFNGVYHPAIAMVHKNGELEVLRQFTYEDYRDRMD